MDEVKSTNTDKYERHDSGAKHNPRQGAEDGLWSACCLQVHLVPPRKSQVVVTHPPHWALYLVPICTGYLGPTGSGTWDQLALVPVTHWLWYLGPTVWGPWYLLDMGPGLQLVLVVTPSCTVLWLIFINLYFKGLCNRLQIGIAQERCDQVDLKFNVVEQDKPWLPRKILVDWNTRHFYDASQNIASPVFYPLSRSRKKIKYFQPPNRTSGKRDLALFWKCISLTVIVLPHCCRMWKDWSCQKKIYFQMKFVSFLNHDVNVVMMILWWEWHHWFLWWFPTTFYIVDLGQALWEMFCNLEKDMLQFWQIHCAIWTNTFTILTNTFAI